VYTFVPKKYTVYTYEAFWRTCSGEKESGEEESGDDKSGSKECDDRECDEEEVGEEEYLGFDPGGGAGDP
jgi:hypothetical protein